MKRFSLAIITALLAGAIFAAHAEVQPRQTPPSLLPREPSTEAPPSDIQLRVERFFIALQNKEILAAFDDLLRGSEFSDQKELVEGFVQDTRKAIELYGDFVGHELFDNRPIGARLILLTYFSHLRKKPLRWRFVFYSPTGSEWSIINLRVDDLLDESILAE